MKPDRFRADAAVRRLVPVGDTPKDVRVIHRQAGGQVAETLASRGRP